MFIGQTVLLRTATLNANGTVTFHNPPVEVARFAGLVPDVATAMSYLPPAERPANDRGQWGGYEVRHDGAFVYTTTVAGTHSAATNLLVVFYDVWADDAARQANPDAPPYRNTHTMQVDPGLNANALRNRVRAIVQETVVRHAVAGRLGDMRDTTLVATQTDPTGVLNKAQPLNGTTATVTPPASSAPLYTMTPK